MERGNGSRSGGGRGSVDRTAAAGSDEGSEDEGAALPTPEDMAAALEEFLDGMLDGEETALESVRAVLEDSDDEDEIGSDSEWPDFGDEGGDFGGPRRLG